MMFNRRRVLQIGAGAIAPPLLCGAARGQAYPSRPVKIVVPVQAGGANDTATRLVVQKVSESLGQQFFVENMVGAGGNIAMGAIARAAADGYSAISVASVS
jgi:tripartite-type tricarboxylate transporter receptor subunit TctC